MKRVFDQTSCSSGFESFLESKKDPVNREVKTDNQTFDLSKSSFQSAPLKRHQVEIENEIVKLNIGGERTMQVSFKVLTKFDESSLASYIRDKESQIIIDGAVFIDRDADVFSMLISFLRQDYFPVIED